MKNEPLPDELHELLWRQKFSAAEWEKLRGLPKISADLEFESRLSAALTKMPDAVVPSNFTARVLQAIDLKETHRSRQWDFNWRFLLPRFGAAAAAILFAAIMFHQHEIQTQRVALAKNVALVAEAQPMPSVEALKNFDAIQRMSQPQHADTELLALLQ
jgi:hypothetical protein